MSTVAGGYLISRLGDPIFALVIGSTSAYIRIKREHKEKYPESPDNLGYLLKLGNYDYHTWMTENRDGWRIGSTQCDLLIGPGQAAIIDIEVISWTSDVSKEEVKTGTELFRSPHLQSGSYKLEP
ncbi:hypothetical protein KEM54_006065 [Ascosphaera aggregata]|nr:hypothetical protein KEM54_006065 [Ascosphaera aggregata]